MLKIGSYNELSVERATPNGLYLKAASHEVLLPQKYVPQGARPGDNLRVFVYTDSKDRPIATTLIPKVTLGQFAYLKVTDTAPFGVFVDWGLEKDLLVPRREQQGPMRIGTRHMLKVCLDSATQRVYGSCKIAANCERGLEDLSIGMAVDLLIYSETQLGVKAIINHRHLGMIYKNEIFETLRPGEKRQGYINRLRPDGKIDLSLKKPGFASISGSAKVIIKALEKAGGWIACHDKSDPAEIKEHFSMSKKEFKRTIGNLYRKGRIDLTSRGIRLKRSASKSSPKKSP